MKRVWKFLCEDDGTAMVEYAVMIALIICICVGGITLVGGGTVNFWGNNQNQLGGVFGS
jgi:Flp pilus assembly pilin Flp